MSKYKKYIAPLAVLLLLIILVAYFRYRERPPEHKPETFPAGRPPAVLNLGLGNPSGATNDPSNKNNYLMSKSQYVLSYNNDKGEPNWVSWHLQSSDIGNVERQNNFHAEQSLPGGFKRVTPDDYTGTGFDRGHVCNSKDRTDTEANNSETFSMANMLPQTPDLNRQVWESLESYCRTLAQQGNQLYIIAGAYGSAKTIGRANKVNVPTNCWKIVVVMPQGSNDLSRIDKNTRVIAVDMPNKQGISLDSWDKYLTTVGSLEQKTGYKFFTDLPGDVQSALKAKKDAGR
ncbi:MAG TPA: DNA/RNA non-specific endonuclease [Pyrinomonadaceae bacterium]|jgi:endonuclease G